MTMVSTENCRMSPYRHRWRKSQTHHALARLREILCAETTLDKEFLDVVCSTVIGNQIGRRQRAEFLICGRSIGHLKIASCPFLSGWLRHRPDTSRVGEVRRRVQGRSNAGVVSRGAITLPRFDGCDLRCS
jgi:hypothetical protein